MASPIQHGHWPTTIFMAWLRFTGLDPPMVVDRAINGEVLLAYVPQVLVPALRPRAIVIMDNLGSDKNAGLCEADETVVERLRLLPPNGPAFGPVGTAF